MPAPDAGVIEDARARRRRRRGAATVAVIAAAAGAWLLTNGGGGAPVATPSHSRPPEPLRKLTGPALTAPTHLRVVAAGSVGPAFVLDVDRAVARPVSGLGLGSGTSEWRPQITMLASVRGGVLAAVWHDRCRRCTPYGDEYLIAPDGRAHRLARLGPEGGPVTVPARGAVASWTLARPRGGPCTLTRVPGRGHGERVPCGDVQAETLAGVWIRTKNRELIVNPVTATIVASMAVARAGRSTTQVYPLDGTLALESAGPGLGETDGHPQDRLSLVDLRDGRRRAVGRPSYFGDLIRVVPEPGGPLVAVDFGSPAYPGPAQAEDIWMLDTATARFTHLPEYPAQVDIKFSDVAWTGDHRLAIIAQGAGRTVLGLWRPGQATLPLRTVPARNGYPTFVPLAR